MNKKSSPTDNFPIKKNVPIPLQRHPNASRYPFAFMEPGDCFDIKDESLYESVRNAAAHEKKKRGKKFVLRKDLDEPGVYARCWRIE